MHDRCAASAGRQPATHARGCCMSVDADAPARRVPAAAGDRHRRRRGRRRRARDGRGLPAADRRRAGRRRRDAGSDGRSTRSPGLAREAEIADARPLGEGVLACRAETRIASSGVRFAEARMAELLGEETVLVDVNRGPAVLARGLRRGDGRARQRPAGADRRRRRRARPRPRAEPREPALRRRHARRGRLAPSTTHVPSPVLAGIFGIGCDGELTPAEVLERLAEVAAAGGLAGARGLTPAVAARLDEAVAAIPTEASAQALRCFRGELGPVPIRDGVRSVELSPLGAATFYFDARRRRRLGRAPGPRRHRRGRPRAGERDPARARRPHRAGLRAGRAPSRYV